LFTRVNPNIFARPARTSFHFWLNTSVVLAVLAETVLILIRFGERLSLLSIGWMSFGLVSLILSWLRMLQAHRVLHSVQLEQKSSRDGCDATSSFVMEAAANMYYGLTFAGIAVGTVLLAFSKALKSFL
jgi:hypothetical protein